MVAQICSTTYGLWTEKRDGMLGQDRLRMNHYSRVLPEFKKTQVFHMIVQIGLYFTNEQHFEGKLGFLELLSIKFESFSQ